MCDVIWVVLESRVPFRVLFIRVPYCIGDHSGDPTLENYAYGITSYYVVGFGFCAVGTPYDIQHLAFQPLRARATGRRRFEHRNVKLLTTKNSCSDGPNRMGANVESSPDERPGRKARVS